MYVIRKRIKLQPEKAIFIFVNNKTLPPTAALMSQVRHSCSPLSLSPFSLADAFVAWCLRARVQIYKEHKDEDGFLCKFAVAAAAARTARSFTDVSRAALPSLCRCHVLGRVDVRRLVNVGVVRSLLVARSLYMFFGDVC